MTSPGSASAPTPALELPARSPPRRRVFRLTLAVALVSCGALAALAAAGWPGEVRATTEFCERIQRDALVRQPANAWSNLAFVLVGLLLAWRADRDRNAPPPGLPRNPMTTTVLFPGLFCSCLVLLGPGSFALHGTMTDWGGRVDVYSMFLFATCPLAYGIMRAWGLSLRTFLALILGLDLLLGVILLMGAALFPFGTLLVATAVSEALARWRGLRRRYAWLLAAIGLFLVALSIWVPSRTGWPLCDPDSIVQGHAVWHILCALSAGCVVLYFRSEVPA